MLGDKNIDDYNIKDIRTFISYINQDTSSLFNRTIFENISYGKQYSDSECLDCIEHVKEIFEEFGLYDIFSNLDKGRDKWSFLHQGVGKMGEKLSGGQKKIIHLLRLELDDNSKIIILDEPTSSVDNKTRNNIINFIRYLNSKGKTLVIITHDQHFRDVSDKVLEFSGNENPRYTK
jgi:ABC-type multidrug transport system fused ATPase/permease subunit